MRTIRREVHVPVIQLEEFAAACTALSKSDTRDIRGDVKAPMLREFKYAMQLNATALATAKEQAGAIIETLYDQEEMQKYVAGADALKRAFCSRDRAGNPKIIKHEDGSEEYVIPDAKREKLAKALDDYAKAHPAIQDMQKAVNAFMATKRAVTLIAVPFRSIPVEVNGAYMMYVDEIVFAKPVYGLRGLIVKPFQWLFAI